MATYKELKDTRPDCLKCGSKNVTEHSYYFIIPGMIIVPNEYRLCKKHKDLRFSFEDVYNEDGSRKEISKDDQ